MKRVLSSIKRGLSKGRTRRNNLYRAVAFSASVFFPLAARAQSFQQYQDARYVSSADIATKLAERPQSLDIHTLGTDAYGRQILAAGIPSELCNFVQAKQAKDEWCWAASVQMILNLHGIQKTQQEVVYGLTGGQPNVPASLETIERALTGYVTNAKGERVFVHATPNANGVTDLINDLAQHNPVLLGLRTDDGIVFPASMRGGATGHAYVLTGIVYTRDQAGRVQPISAVVRDPWPGNPDRQEIPWQQVASRFMFMVRSAVN